MQLHHSLTWWFCNLKAGLPILVCGWYPRWVWFLGSPRSWIYPLELPREKGLDLVGVEPAVFVKEFEDSLVAGLPFVSFGNGIGNVAAVVVFFAIGSL